MREELPEEVTLEKDIEKVQIGHRDAWGKNIRGRRNSSYDGPKVGASEDQQGASTARTE